MRFAISLAVVLVTTKAFSEPKPNSSLSLEWIAPSECPSGDWIRREISRLLGRELSQNAAAAWMVRASVSHEAGTTYRAFLRTQSAEVTGERTIEDPVCARVAEAAALVVALAIDPSAVVENEKRDRPHVIVRPPEPRPIQFANGVVFATDVGTLPEVSFGLGLTFGLLLGPSLRVEAMATSWLPRDVLATSGVPGGAHVRNVFLGSLRACAAQPWRSIEVGGCAGVEAASLQSKGFGISNPTTTYGVWAAGTVGPTFTLNVVPWLALRAAIDLAFAPVRPEFTVHTYQSGTLATLHVYRPSWIAGRPSATVEIRY